MPKCTIAPEHIRHGGGWLANAVWPNKAARDAYFASDKQDHEAGDLMKSAVEHRFDELHLTIVDDLLVTPTP